MSFNYAQNLQIGLLKSLLPMWKKVLKDYYHALHTCAKAFDLKIKQVWQTISISYVQNSRMVPHGGKHLQCFHTVHLGHQIIIFLGRLYSHSFPMRILSRYAGQHKYIYNFTSGQQYIWKMHGWCCVVIPPNLNTFSDWRRTCHVSQFLQSFLSYFWVGVYNKTLIDPRETVIWGKQSSLFPLGPVFKYLLIITVTAERCMTMF